jgi:hypothetical protein
MAAVGQSKCSVFGSHIGLFYLMDFEAKIGSVYVFLPKAPSHTKAMGKLKCLLENY